jgi:uncharacterized protein (DUF1501 family)
MKKRQCTRRHLLQGLGLAGGAFLFKDLMPGFATASTFDADNAPLLIICNFNGGWDQLLALDPRDNTLFGANDAIYPAYDLHAVGNSAFSQVMAESYGTGLVKPDGSNITFGPCVGRLADHFEELCVVRGINMGTLTHEVGDRYFNTGKFPRGLAANGSSLGTWHSDQTGDISPIPNLVIGMETFNEGLANYATGLSIKQSVDLLTVLTQLGTPLNNASNNAVADYLWTQKCSDFLYDNEAMVSTYLDSRNKALMLASGDLAEHFMFLKNTKNQAIKDVYAAFQINVAGNTFNKDIAGPKGQAAIAAQAITQGLSQAVSVRLVGGIDTHDDDYQTIHASSLQTGFNALADLISFLKNTEDGNGLPFWNRVTLLCTSEFARTPKINVRGGRDHHLASSCLAAGNGIRGNRVVGGTRDEDFSSYLIDPESGATVENGIEIRPPDIHATLLKAMGMSYDHISNQQPKIISAMLESS